MKQSTFWISMLGIFLLSLTICFTTQAQEKTKENSYDKTVSTVSKGVSTVYDDLKSTAPKVTEALNSLSKELKIGVNAVWDVLVKQQKVWSIGFLILTLGSLINWYIFYTRNFRKLSKNDYEIGKKDNWVTIDNPDFNQEFYNKYAEDVAKGYNRAEAADIRYKKKIRVNEGLTDILLPKLTPDNGLGGVKYIHLILCISLTLLSVYHFMDMLTGFFNPEFGAMKTIAEIAQQIK